MSYTPDRYIDTSGTYYLQGHRERAEQGHKDIKGNISRKREMELKDDYSRMEKQAVMELL